MSSFFWKGAATIAGWTGRQSRRISAATAPLLSLVSKDAKLRAECLRVRREIIDFIKKHRGEIRITTRDGRLHYKLLDITEMVLNPQNESIETALARLGETKVDWKYFASRVKPPHEYAAGKVELVTTLLKPLGNGAEVVFDYFYKDSGHGRIIAAVTQPRQNQWEGRVFTGDYLPSLFVQSTVLEGEIPYKAYPLQLGSMAQALSELAFLLGIKAVSP